jgi:RimJ/RimL family protein N-acetyltransferase
MIVKQYGITYKRVCEGDLELLRYWRNQSFIRNTMQYREYITSNQQRKWFNKINNKYNFYFLIEYDKKKIGLINCKDAEENSNIAEGGIFIWDKSYWGSSIPALASLSMLQAVFEIFQSGEASIARVAVDNVAALDFNQKLGYQIVGKTPDQSFYKLYLSKEHYLNHTKKLIKAARILSNGNSELEIVAEESDLLPDIVNSYIKAINSKK